MTVRRTSAPQVSLYPLRQHEIGPPIREALRVFRRHGLDTRVGEMSTLVWGASGAVSDALQEAFLQTADRGDTVMVVTLSSACPQPERERTSGHDARSSREAGVLCATPWGRSGLEESEGTGVRIEELTVVLRPIGGAR